MDDRKRRELIQKSFSLAEESRQTRALQRCLQRIIYFQLQERPIRSYHQDFYKEVLLDIAVNLGGMSPQKLKEKPGDLEYLCTRLCPIAILTPEPKWFRILAELRGAIETASFHKLDWKALATELS